MIQNEQQYQKALEDLQYMEDWLRRLLRDPSGSNKGLTKAGIRKMIAGLQDELGAYEGQLEVSVATKSQ
ncbi:MAG: hypothetical protein QF473_06335 [Planctomycetota bacterium]|jgi:hypothetical protein|nr:hypothetical protein [Planctomycetota bacterium]